MDQHGHLQAAEEVECYGCAEMELIIKETRFSFGREMNIGW